MTRFLRGAAACLLCVCLPSEGFARGRVFGRAGKASPPISLPGGAISLQGGTVLNPLGISGLSRVSLSPVLPSLDTLKAVSPSESAAVVESGSEAFESKTVAADIAAEPAASVPAGVFRKTREFGKRLTADAGSAGSRLAGFFSGTSSRGGLPVLNVHSSDPGGEPIEFGREDPGPRFPKAKLREPRGAGLLNIDIRDSTGLFQRIGNRRGNASVNAYLDYVADFSRRFEGRVVRRLGDGLLILFPSAGKALEAGLAVQDRLDEWQALIGGEALELHAAVNGGRVLVEENGLKLEVYGQTVERVIELLDWSEGDVVMDPLLADAPSVRPVLEGRTTASRGSVLVVPSGKPRKSARGRLPGTDVSLAVLEIARRATVFTDLKDWAGKYDRFGRRKAFATVKAYQAFVRRIVERRGGEVVKTRGEGFMLSFESAADAILAGAEMQNRIEELRAAVPLGEYVAIRIGISYGKVFIERNLEGSDYFGNTVNAAARFLGKNQEGGLTVSQRVLDDPQAVELLRSAEFLSEKVFLKGFQRKIAMLHIRPESLKGEAGADSMRRYLRRIAWSVYRELTRVRRDDAG